LKQCILFEAVFVWGCRGSSLREVANKVQRTVGRGRF